MSVTSKRTMDHNNDNSCVLMVKPVGSKCNMRCSYCYYLNKAQELHETDCSIMTDRILESMIQQYLQSCSGPVASITWHGGEPTMAGLDFFRKAVMFEKKYRKKSQQIWNILQSNGLLIDKEWARFLRENHFSVGISIDGDIDSHNMNRKTVSGQDSWSKVIEAIKALQAEGIQPDLLCTVNAKNVSRAKEIYYTLKNLKTGWIQFIPIVNKDVFGTVTEDSVDSSDYGDFLITIYDLWKEDGGNKSGTLIQLFAEMDNIDAGGQPSLCTMTRFCGKVLVAEMDGSVYSCDHYVFKEYKLGNINQRSLKKMTGSEEQHAFGSNKEVGLTDECRLCEWLKYCNGGCPKDRFVLSRDGEKGQSYLCKGLKKFFNHTRS